MSFYRYVPELDVHIVDGSGTVDLQLGLARLALLRRELDARPSPSGVQRLLIDFRHAVWDSDETHRQLSLATRRTLGLEPSNTAIRAAFLHHSRAGTSHNEGWFSDQAEALDWLTRA